MVWYPMMGEVSPNESIGFGIPRVYDDTEYCEVVDGEGSREFFDGCDAEPVIRLGSATSSEDVVCVVFRARTKSKQCGVTCRARNRATVRFEATGARATFPESTPPAPTAPTLPPGGPEGCGCTG